MSPHDEYFNWLTSQIKTPRNKTYDELFQMIHQTDFLWVIPNDDNRVQDGLDLRVEFGIPVGSTHIVSILELLIGLSRRLAFVAGGEQEEWAWQLIKNLELDKMSDPLDNVRRTTIGNILYNLVWRTYFENGLGGFFPLKNPQEDQTKVELWYQMNSYVNEMLAV